MTTSPYDRGPQVPSFTVTSTDVADGEGLPAAQFTANFGMGGTDTSPQLSWSGAPVGTMSYAVTVYDPDVPPPCGFWHWAVADIPAATTSLPVGAGDDTGSGLPAGAFQLPNDARLARYIGAAPPAGSGRHRYYVVVHAVDTASLTTVGIGKDTTPAMLSLVLLNHTLGRAVLTPWAER
ncbi:YbhB/YbcL family Raf kinase inhibitor-like protein [Streptomyces sp. NBC_00459]|uniref:YbhB/YbcL family Raf kinase inhibitor-like protein n=1 Tax=Streptomyces sp. NBC_00459 TaxID=2975749 RepID=UPI002E189B53